MAWPKQNPQAADTTLWPGRAPAAVDLLARGEMPPPVDVSSPAAPPKTGARPVTADVPATTSEQHTFDKSRAPDPRRQSDGPAPPRTP